MTDVLPTKGRPSNGANGKPLIGITMGDPGGIGAEVIVKALHDPVIRDLARFVVYGIDRVLTEAAVRSGIRPFWFRLEPGQPVRVDSGVVTADFDEFQTRPWNLHRPSAAAGQASLRFLDEAITAVREGQTDALVTGPIHKGSWKLAGANEPGHTERLAAAFNTKRVSMMFVGGGLRVALASAHVGLFELRNLFTIGMVFQPIDLLHEALRKWFGVARPRIAVAGLNPHAGEGGQFGDEERRVVEPAVQMARNVGLDVHGPFPADTLFLPKVRKAFDGLVAMYHDQGLIPVKMLAFDSAVNVTLGLPIIRTSVDHGTAFDIAGRNQADPGSMKEAIRLALTLAAQRPAKARAAAPAAV
jgi:4-hydroxythreonine-4-phosphate dehydrogenase